MEQEWESFKEQVRSSANILEVASSYVNLQRRGRRYWGCCPFHGEKTPSFSVNPDKGLFYCFGCHAGGDVFAFVRQIEHCDFSEALKLLAARYHIPVPEGQKSAQEAAREQQRQAVVEANELACRYFQACLTKMPQGREALDYLAARGINASIIQRFSLGYALPSFRSLLVNLSKRGIKEEVLLAAGLVAKGREGSCYDKFRQRVMIPIKNPRGQIVGYGGRLIGAQQAAAKYMNTAETDFFNKRYLLFALDVALPAIRAAKQAIVVEGYMDAISLHAAGIENAVASMGTAFSQQQARLLGRCAGEVVFCYDSDPPGRAAAVRAVSLARSNGLQVRVALVPEGKDPDEFIRARGSQGREAFLQVIARAEEGLAFQLNEVLRQNNTTSLAGKVQAVANIIPFLLEGGSEIEAAAYIRQLAQRLVIDEALILEEYRKAARSQGRRQPGGRTAQAVAETPVQQVPEGLPAEKLLLVCLLNQPQLLPNCAATVERWGFSCPAYQAIYEGLQAYEAAPGAGEVGSFLAARLEEEEGAGRALAQLAAQPLPGQALDAVVGDCCWQLDCHHLQQEYQRHAALAAEYVRAQDGRYVEELAASQQIKQQISQLYRDRGK